MKFLLVLLLLLGAAGLGGYFQLREWAYRPVHVESEQVVAFPADTRLRTLAQSLEDAGVVSSGSLFRTWIRLEGGFHNFQAGKYRFDGDVSPQDVINKMIRGDVFHPVILQVTVPEGWTMRQVVERLAANSVGHIVELKRLTTDQSFLASLNIKDAQSLEGYLYPATYNFTEIPTARQALETMAKTFFQNLPKGYEQKAREKGLTLQQAVTFASLIEAETRHADERLLVSEVIWRRLKDGMPLGIDAALIYGIADYAGDLKWSHLSDASNLYNGRIHKGLPPGPIGSPSVASLEAVLTPANNGYYYYVLMPNADRHHFSKTLKEHNQHVQKLINAGRQGSKAEKNK